ncbi:MAG: hypothetical protein AB7I42_03590 [Bradyrhizobium sp.]|uniref:hypothetical protein n=1 Tax=Bradyrhizobium sp. TaxID=376 RepID=UPI0035332013
MRNRKLCRNGLIVLVALAPALAGCNSGLDQFQSDFISKDAQWFKRSGRLFIRNVSIDAPPLTPEKPVAPDDLVSADGACPGMAPPANALADDTADAPPPVGGTVALLHTECDVVRGIGTPDSVNISASPGGGRMAVVTYLRGPRAGIYTFTGGRLSSVEAVPEQPAPPKPARSRPKRKPA